jgi:hypothetical protein
LHDGGSTANYRNVEIMKRSKLTSTGDLCNYDCIITVKLDIKNDVSQVENLILRGYRDTRSLYKENTSAFMNLKTISVLIIIKFI